ncbi:prepilin peptidase [Salinispora fenicalii]|uniref:prepilin peptidase n=1 Tax=Salinispora fenicalii TaxID=1137263 RepID=UPI000483A2D9|nr:A24 family peptidase [Salinispora fenicalii]
MGFDMTVTGSRRTAPRSLLAALAVTPALRLAAVRHSVPVGVTTRLGCDACGAPISLTQAGPAIGPRARCGGCGARVGPPPGTVEVAALAAALMLLLAGGPVIELVAAAWWLGWAVPLAFVDAAVHRLPDRLTGPATLGTWLLFGLAATLDTGYAPWLRATAAGLGLGLLFATSTLLLGRRGFGLGDAKLAVGVGLLLGWHGWPFLVLGLLLAFTLAAVTALALLATGRARWSSHLPFGPFLLLATPATLLLTG